MMILRFKRHTQSMSSLGMLVLLCALYGRPVMAGDTAGAGNAAAVSVQNVHDVVIVENGVARMKILTGPSMAQPDKGGTPPARRSAQELQLYVHKMSGAELEISVASPDSTGIFVGTAADFPWLKLEPAVQALSVEGFIIRNDADSLFLLAREEKGISHAVVTLLQSLGCRWFFPGETWEIVPDLKTIRGHWNEKQSPSFNIQRHLGYGFGSYSVNKTQKQAWDRHNRAGAAMPVAIGHAGHGLSDADFARNPDMFAMRDGVRVNKSKPCYSNPVYIQRAVSRVLAAAESGKSMISMTPADGLGYCECPLCHKWARGGDVFWNKGSQFAKRPDGKLVSITSESLFNCINEAARALQKQHPDVLIGTYAYSAYSHPPSFPIEPNVFIQTTTCYRRTPVSLEEQLRIFKAMGVQSGIRAYWSVYQWDWDYPTIKGELGLPRLVNDIRFYHANGARSLNTEMSCNWGPRGLGYYLGQQLLWDVDVDPKAIIDDFYRKAFGPAAEAMERYYACWMGDYVRVINPPADDAPLAATAREGSGDATVQDELGAMEAAPTAFGRESLRAAFQDLDEAAELVRDMPAYLARVNDLRLYAHYLSLRLRLQELPFRDLAAVVENTKEVFTGRTGERRAAIVEAIKAETVFGARIMDTNMIHTRPLIGKAFHRRFKKYGKLLEGTTEWPEGNPKQAWGEGFRAPRHDVPSAKEIEALWASDRAFLNF